MDKQKALEKLRMECSRMELCTGQVMRKLLRWRQSDLRNGRVSLTEEEMASIVESLVKERFVDDSRFAEAYVRDKARFAKWGRVKISYNLKSLGIGESIISGAIAANSSLFDGDLLDSILEKKLKQLKESDSPKVKREKLLRFALGRGFEYDQIIPKIKNLG